MPDTFRRRAWPQVSAEAVPALVLVATVRLGFLVEWVPQSAEHVRTVGAAALRAVEAPAGPVGLLATVHCHRTPAFRQ